MLVVCLRIPHFALRVSVLGQPEYDGGALVLSNPQSGRSIVIDATTEARNKGVRPGISIREALALCPEAIILLPNPVEETRVSSGIRDRLEQMSPLVESDPAEPGCWYIDLTGLERHYDSPAHAARRFLQTIPAVFRPRASVAPGKFAARVAAGMTAPGSVKTIEPASVRSFLGAASVTWLPLPGDTIHQLQRLGLETLGDLANLPGAKVAARFGPAGRTAWELAQGIDSRPVISPPRIETFSETLIMPTPAVSREMLLVGLRQLIGRMFSQPALRGKQVREMQLSAVIERGKSWERTLVLKEPCGAERLVQAIDLRLQALELPGPIEAITLDLRGITREIAWQETLPQLRPRHDPPLTAAVQQLKQRYGLSPLYRIVEVEPWSRIPERRHALITYDP
jgi:DNA polymerase-4/protein ImuB